MPMKKSVKRRWIHALTRKRNPYVQGQNALITINEDKPNEFCCLGVLQDIAVKDGILKRHIHKNGKPGLFVNNEGKSVGTAWPDDKVLEWSGLPDPTGIIPREHYITVAEILEKHNIEPTYLALNLRAYVRGGIKYSDANLAAFNDRKVPFHVIAEIIEVAF